MADLSYDSTNPTAASSAQMVYTPPINYSQPNTNTGLGVTAGGALDWLGTALGLPEMNMSEGLAGGRTANTGYAPTSVAAGYPGINYLINPTNPNPTPTGTPTSTKTTTQNTGQTSGGTPPVDMNYYQGWNDQNAIKADWANTWQQKTGQGGGGGGGGEPDWSQLISDAYAPALGALGGIETSLQQGQQEGLGGIEQTYGEGQGTIGREKGELEASLTEQGRRLAETVRSAYSDALRAYNNLIQQGMARFGSGSSAGPAVQELVNQEFMRSRGKLGQQAVQGEQQMTQEWTKLGNYITQKKTDLDQWKRGAVQQINDNFRNAMSEIAMRRGEIEANKTKDKVAALQNAVNQARQIESEDRQVRMNLAQFAVETMQNLSQRAFTPQEIASVYGQVMQAEIPGMVNRASTSAGTTTNPTSYYNPYSSRKTSEEETTVQ